MCGLFGWDFRAGKISKKRLHSLALVLAIRNDNRGGDSWGYHVPGTDVFNRALGDSVFVAHKLSEHWRMMAHTRKATTGARTIPNCHPFQIGNIIGAHNGMISNHSDLNKKYSRNHEVDSMHIFSHLDEGKELKELEGYGTITFVDKRVGAGEVRMVQLRNGDLEVASVDGGTVWSSSKSHLEEALKVAGLEYKLYDIKEGQVYVVDGDGTLYIQKGQELTISSGYTSRSYYGGHNVTHLVRHTEGDLSDWWDGGWSSRRGALWDDYWETQELYREMVVANGLGAMSDFPTYEAFKEMTEAEREDIIPDEHELANMAALMGIDIPEEELSGIVVNQANKG